MEDFLGPDDIKVICDFVDPEKSKVLVKFLDSCGEPTKFKETRFERHIED